MSRKSKSPGRSREKDKSLWTYRNSLRPSLEECGRKAHELRERWKERLGETRCPECGSDSYFEWLIGWWPDEEHYHDPNRKECVDCGHWWWIECPTCDHNKDMTKEKYFSKR